MMDGRSGISESPPSKRRPVVIIVPGGHDVLGQRHMEHARHCTIAGHEPEHTTVDQGVNSTTRRQRRAVDGVGYRLQRHAHGARPARGKLAGKAKCEGRLDPGQAFHPADMGQPGQQAVAVNGNGAFGDAHLRRRPRDGGRGVHGNPPSRLSGGRERVGQAGGRGLVQMPPSVRGHGLSHILRVTVFRGHGLSQLLLIVTQLAVCVTIRDRLSLPSLNRHLPPHSRYGLAATIAAYRVIPAAGTEHIHATRRHTFDFREERVLHDVKLRPEVVTLGLELITLIADAIHLGLMALHDQVFSLVAAVQVFPVLQLEVRDRPIEVHDLQLKDSNFNSELDNLGDVAAASGFGGGRSVPLDQALAIEIGLLHKGTDGRKPLALRNPPGLTGKDDGVRSTSPTKSALTDAVSTLSMASNRSWSGRRLLPGSRPYSAIRPRKNARASSGTNNNALSVRSSFRSERKTTMSCAGNSSAAGTFTALVRGPLGGSVDTSTTAPRFSPSTCSRWSTAAGGRSPSAAVNWSRSAAACEA